MSIVCLKSPRQKILALRSLLWLTTGVASLAALLFLTAGTIKYWEAWVYLLNTAIMSFWLTVYLFIHDPELLERRLRTGERHKSQRTVIAFAWIWFFIFFITPGLDRRYSISEVAAPVVLSADLFIVSSYLLILKVFRANPYASRLIEIAVGQTTVTKGPYAKVRHPMYLGAMGIYLFTPLALGSWLAIIPAVFIIPILVARIRHEEAFLMRRLPGYREYMASTPYRIIPGIW